MAPVPSNQVPQAVPPAPSDQASQAVPPVPGGQAVPSADAPSAVPQSGAVGPSALDVPAVSGGPLASDQFPGAYPGPAGPYNSDPVLYPGAARDEWTAPDEEEDKKRKTLRLVLAGVVTLLVVFVAFLLLSPDGSKAQAEASASASREAAVETAVRGYLEAVARGDASRALDYLAEKPDSTELLTDDVLAASREAAKLTNVDVRARSGTGDSIEVKASYRLGDAGVDQTFTVKERNGSWKVVNGTATVDLSAGDLPLAINGQAVSDSSAAVLFPGSYALTVAGDTGKYVTLETTTFQVTNLNKVKVPTISATLTEEGAAAFRQAVRAAVEACVASPNLDSGCKGSGLDVPAELGDGTAVAEGTVVRTLSPELSAALDALAPRLYTTNPGRAYAAAPDGLVNLAITGTRDGQAVAGDITNAETGGPGFQLGTPEVDMSDPALPVTWSGR